jgi:hypothetical protein
VVLAVELSFTLIDAALLSVAVAFAVFEVWGLERFATRRAASSRARPPRRAVASPPKLATDAGEDVARSAVAVAAERAPFEALGEMYPLLTARAARVLEDRFAYSGPGTAPTLPSGETPERWRAIAETLEGSGAAADDAPSGRAVQDDVEEVEPIPPGTDPVLLATSHDPPLVRWAAAVALVLAVLLLLLIL